MNFIFGAIATPHEFYIGAKRHLLKPVRPTGVWAEATSRRKPRWSGSERATKGSCAKASVA